MIFILIGAMMRSIVPNMYGNSIPLDEKMISPRDMFDSEILKEVK